VSKSSPVIHSAPSVGRLKANRWFATFWDWMSSHESKPVKKIRASIVSQASGRVLEIGSGTGASFQYYIPEAHVVATEPDAEMLKRAARHIDERGITNVELHRAPAEAVPFEAASFDTVVSCLVFCHVDDASAALSEIRRVLKPGGSFLFMEHVRSENGLWGWLQDRVNPVWRRLLGAGCNCNRRTQKAIEAAGLTIESITREGAVPPTSPYIYGVART